MLKVSTQFNRMIAILNQEKCILKQKWPGNFPHRFNKMYIPPSQSQMGIYKPSLAIGTVAPYLQFIILINKERDYILSQNKMFDSSGCQNWK